MLMYSSLRTNGDGYVGRLFEFRLSTVDGGGPGISAMACYGWKGNDG